MAIWKYKNSLLPVIVSMKTKLRVNNKTIATNNIESSRSEPRHLKPCDGLCASNHSAKSSFVKRSDVSGTAWPRATSNAFYFTFEFKLTFGPVCSETFYCCHALTFHLFNCATPDGVAIHSLKIWESVCMCGVFMCVHVQVCVHVWMNAWTHEYNTYKVIISKLLWFRSETRGSYFEDMVPSGTTFRGLEVVFWEWDWIEGSNFGS